MSNEMTEPAEEAAGGRPASRSVALWVLTATVALVPLATSNLVGFGIGAVPLTYDDIALPRLVIALVGMCAAWAAWLWGSSRAGIRPRMTPTLGILAALAVWAGVSAAVSPHWALGVLGQSERLEGVVTVVAYALLFGIGLQVVRRAADARFLAIGVTLAAAVSAVLGLLQSIGIDPMAGAIGGRAFSAVKAYATFGNPNFLAGLLVLVAPVAVGLAISARERAGMAGWGAAAILIAGVLVTTYTRGALIGAAVEVALLVFLLARGGLRVSRAASWFLVVLIAGATLYTASTFIRDTEQGSASDREEIMSMAAVATVAKPVFGWGPDAFMSASRLHRTRPLAQKFGYIYTTNNVHSWPLQYSATLGLPGALLLLAALGWGLWGPWRVLSARRGDLFDPVMAGILIGCVGFVVHMMTSVAVLGATVPFWVLLGALAAPCAKTVAVPRAGMRIGAIGVGVVAIGVTVLGGMLLGADHVYLRSRTEYHAREYAASAVDASTAVRLNPLSLKYRRGLAQSRLSQTFAAMTARAANADVMASWAVADGAFNETLSLDADDYAALAWRAGFDEEVGAYTGDAAIARAAIEAARKAALLDVDHPEVSALARGDTSAGGVSRALAVPATP